MEQWKPNPCAELPLYRQIAEQCRRRIASGQWPAGFRLPAQRKLAAELGVNRSTLAQALAELIADGLLAGRIGSGTFVANDSWSLLNNPPPPDWRQYAAAGAQKPNLPTIQSINRNEFRNNVVRLGTGELSPELMPQTAMARCLQQLSQKLPSLGYEQPNGSAALRLAISRRLQQQGVFATPESILIVSGALQALQLISTGLLPPGAEILLEQPSYLSSLTLFQTQFARLTPLPLDEQGVSATALKRSQIAQRADLLYTIPCFHNPTGITMTKRRRREIMELCRSQRLPILEDDVYRDLWLDAPPPAPLKAADTNGLVLYLGSLSKSLSPGLRIGWLVGPEPVINRLADLKMQFDYGASSISQSIAEWWLNGEEYDNHLAALREQLRLRRAAALAALQRHFFEVAEWNVPAGGFYIWLTLKQPISLPRLFQAALQQGMLLNPGYLYDGAADRQLRISYSYATAQELSDALWKLAQLIEKESENRRK